MRQGGENDRELTLLKHKIAYGLLNTDKMDHIQNSLTSTNLNMTRGHRQTGQRAGGRVFVLTPAQRAHPSPTLPPPSLESPRGSGIVLGRYRIQSHASEEIRLYKLDKIATR